MIIYVYARVSNYKIFMNTIILYTTSCRNLETSGFNSNRTNPHFFVLTISLVNRGFFAFFTIVEKNIFTFIFTSSLYIENFSHALQKFFYASNFFIHTKKNSKHLSLAINSSSTKQANSATLPLATTPLLFAII
ncbi:hypothetical protein MS2017_0023 [Bathymodiolus thermophilus thioautotrophic gill symbiont]|uniref:Uncharacterized protein n=1 Tax=Bathymodiolus thermophilus thioautotrophic gill symbiont TaxID=2360 RepID=A0A3G3IIX5_9GAMM|nr:hypothetical protein MS2017_0023 [Bathymodiolus thermophilus thioautotrophic gill symbiont]